jgi:actin, other eukaryote
MLDSPFSSDESRERLTSLMFETFNAPSMYIDTTAACSLYASGRTTGCVLESGHGCSHVVPFYEGYAFSHLAKAIPIAGADVTAYLETFYVQSRGLSEEGSSNVNLDMARTIKERFGTVKIDESVFSLRDAELKYELPDGNSILIEEERYQCAESLFTPRVMHALVPATADEYVSGFSSTLFETIGSCAEEIRNEIYSGIILSGGNTMFLGMAERLKADLCSWIKSDVDTFGSASNVNIVASPDRYDIDVEKLCIL